MSKKAKKKTEIIFVCILLVACLALYYFIFLSSSDDNKIVKEITEYGYTLEDRDSKLMQDVFASLDEALNQETVDYEKYAEYLGKLFIIDLYTISNKENMYDIGSLEYIYPADREEFKINLRNTLYRYLEDKDSRTEDMPEVKTIDMLSLDKGTFNYAKKEYESYVVKLKWDYFKELGYDAQGNVTLIKIENKLYVAKYIPEVTQ